MAIEPEWRNDGEGLILTGSGDVVGADIFETASNLFTAAMLSRLKYQIWDYSRVSSFIVTNAEVHALSQLTKSTQTKGDHRRFAAMVAPQDIAFGQSRQWEMMTGDESERDGIFGVFRSREQAEAWINESMVATYGADAAPFDGSE